MSDGGGGIGDALHGIAEEFKDQTKQLVTGIPQQAAAQVTGKAPSEDDHIKQQQKAIQTQQKVANLRTFLSSEAQRSTQLSQTYRQGDIVSSNSQAMSQLSQGTQGQSVGLQTVIRSKHQETKGNKSGE